MDDMCGSCSLLMGMMGFRRTRDTYRCEKKKLGERELFGNNIMSLTKMKFLVESFNKVLPLGTYISFVGTYHGLASPAVSHVAGLV
jgi:hypothetical protein